MEKSASYVLAAYSFIFSNPIEKILDVGNRSKEGNPIPSFDEDLLVELCSDVQEIFEKENNILEINGDLIVVGDIHGSLHDLLRIINFIQENKLQALFLGDYVDRGCFSLECITLLFALKVMYPDQYFLIRGNHEFDSMCSQYGFKDEILNYHNPKKLKKVTTLKMSEINILTLNLEEEDQQERLDEIDVQCDEYFANHKDADCYKYTEKLYNSFIQAFSYLPIASIVNRTTFCIHGGLSPRLERLSHIQKGIIRPISNFEESQLFSDLLWSDPSSSFPYLFGDNPRGRGHLFNGNAVDVFLLKNGLQRLIRAHQCVKYGSETHFQEKCITVFSSSSYSKDMGNKSGILKLFEKDDRIDYITFEPLKRLQKSETVYYKVQNCSKKMRMSICFSISHPKLVQRNARRARRGGGCSLFITNPKRKRAAIKKPIISHSNSLYSMLGESHEKEGKIEIAQSMMNFGTGGQREGEESPISLAKSRMGLGESLSRIDEDLAS